MEISSPVHERESEIEYEVDHEKTKEPKELKEKEAQTANQKLKKLSTKLGRLPRVQPIKSCSIIKGEKNSKGIFMSSQHSINEFKNCLQNWPWSKFKSKLCYIPHNCFVMFPFHHFQISTLAQS